MMDGTSFNNPFVSELEESMFVHHMADSPPLSGVTNNGKLTTAPFPSPSPSPSPKRSKRVVQKKVVTVPISDANASRLRGEGAPPSDSWAWRKYGQKPIKGSPYPRGYYRCSSSKGCPARKQVERSRADPTMLVITYASDHNHTWPAFKNNTPTTISSTKTNKPPPKEPTVFTIEPETDSEIQFPDLAEDSLITTDDFSWYSDVETTSSRRILDTPIYSNVLDTDMAMIFPMREEDESLFADLGELPECSLVFRREEVDRRRCNLRASWCESTG